MKASEPWWHPSVLFEFGDNNRLLAMEGLRGLAVSLVFLHHYCVSFVERADLSVPTRLVAVAFRRFGNYGVELFFVLSGFLIYRHLLTKRPRFLPFMKRRAIRLYPAFLVALLIGISVDFLRPTPTIPRDASDAVIYLAANLAFLPGLLPIEPLFEVNWSLSYEWWFYVICTLLIGSPGLARLAPRIRVIALFGIATVLIALDARDLPHVPIRGLCLLAGMLLAEAIQAGARHQITSLLTLPLLLLTFVFVAVFNVPAWQNFLVLAVTFYALSAAALHEESAAAGLLRVRPLRWLGNMSYSFYLVHGFVVVAISRVLLADWMPWSAVTCFWVGLLPSFGLCLIVSAVLFLLVEKPLSFKGRAKQPPPTQGQ